MDAFGWSRIASRTGVCGSACVGLSTTTAITTTMTSEVDRFKDVGHEGSCDAFGSVDVVAVPAVLSVLSFLSLLSLSP